VLTREGEGEVLFWHNSPGITLDGFTITGGKGKTAGGIRLTQPVTGAPGRIANCRFRNNQGTEAGAILANRLGASGRAKLEISNCTFENNTAANGAAILQAGMGMDIGVTDGKPLADSKTSIRLAPDATLK